MSVALQGTLLNDYHLLSYDVLDSTNDEAKRLASGGGAHGAVIWAKRQTAGRGRMGREWVSAEGNLFVSILLSPNKPLEQCAQLSFVTANALVETLDGIVPNANQVACKWPNDILLNGKKLSGVLMESFTIPNEFGREVPWVVIGVGVNIDSHPEHVIFPATSMREAGVDIISAKIVLSRFIHNFVQHYDKWMEKGFNPVQKTWMKRAYRIGRPMEVTIGDAHHDGLFTGIDNAGRLLLTQENGKIFPVVAGDVFFKE